MLERYIVAQTLATYLSSCLTKYISELTQLCEIDSKTFHTAGINQMADWVCNWVRPHHWQVRKWLDEETGNSIMVTVRGGNPNGLRVLLATHLDTMFPRTAFEQLSLRRDGDHLICPGVAANKSGLLSGLYAMESLENLELLEPFGCISLFCGSDEEDEEHGMNSSTALLRELAPNYDVSFVLEAGCENGDIIGGRKGCGQFILDNRSQTLNANDVTPSISENSIMALVRQIIALQQLNGMQAGISVNVGVVQGEASPFYEIASARAEIAAWVTSSKEKEAVSTAITHIASIPFIFGITTTLKCDWRFAPVEETPENRALAILAKTCARELNFDVAITRVRGLSYANILAGLGLPILDGLGPSGGYLHTPYEYINVSSIMPRIALLVLLMVLKARQM